MYFVNFKSQYMLQIDHYILIHHKKILLLLLGFNRKLDRNELFTYFQYIRRHC
jgi:hypothetical protein